MDWPANPVRQVRESASNEQIARAQGCQVEGLVLNHLQPIADLATVTFCDSFGTLELEQILAKCPFADDGVELLERYLRCFFSTLAN